MPKVNGVATFDFSKVRDSISATSIREAGTHASGLVPAKTAHAKEGDFETLSKVYVLAQGKTYAAALHANGVKGYSAYADPAIAPSVEGEKTIGLALVCGSLTEEQAGLSTKVLNACETGIIAILRKIAKRTSTYSRTPAQRVRDMSDAKKFRMIFRNVKIASIEHRNALINLGYTGLIGTKTGDTRIILTGIKPLLPTPDTDTEKGKKTDKKTTAPKTAPKARKTAPKKPANVTASV